MRPEEPYTLARLLELRIQIAHHRDEGACAAVCSNDGCAVRATQRIFGMLVDRARKEASM
jgi:hypothetical protein